MYGMVELELEVECVDVPSRTLSVAESALV